MSAFGLDLMTVSIMPWETERDKSSGIVVKVLDPNPGVPCSKPLGGSKVDSAFHPSEVDKMSTRNLWELGAKN